MSNYTHYILQGLAPATKYTVSVLSVNENGTSVPSPRQEVFTLPGGSATPCILYITQNRHGWEGPID